MTRRSTVIKMSDQNGYNVVQLNWAIRLRATSMIPMTRANVEPRISKTPTSTSSTPKMRWIQPQVVTSKVITLPPNVTQ